MTIFERLVKHFGTQDKTAISLGVKQGTVSGWIRGEHGMSAITAIRAEQVTNGAFRAVELCPALKRAEAA
jgi:DNA-binding transcriptional regulator YdaS (Cro superfamily)